MASLQEFRSINRDLSFVLYDSIQRDAYMEREWQHHPVYDAYKFAKIGALKADVFRYCILYQFGGYYFDISKGVSVPITSLHDPSASSFLTFESHRDLSLKDNTDGKLPPNLFAQWGFGFVPRHPILENQISFLVSKMSEIKDIDFPDPKSAILNFSGPISFSKSVRKYIHEGGTGSAIAGIDFEGHGIFSLRGSGSRYLLADSYAKLKNTTIMSSHRM